ncbi:Phosphoglycerate mutase family [hydrothermal vent metagenome]|uniref:Phosphoglycerate mutase family n=1 Tax=hydrothermal vent metagenome TaxID=652676 RepID=A0A1W1CMU2_9ZZZZ
MAYPKIILVRHGETKWNVEGRYQGQLDSPLTERGIKQAKKNGQKIKRHLAKLGKDEVKIFSSPLGRAKSTAFLIVDELGLSPNRVIVDTQIQEFNYGILEGKTKEYCNENHNEIIKAREANKWFYQIENGDSYELVAKRVKSWLDKLDSDITIIAITHEMVNRALRKLYRKISIDEALSLRQPNNMVLILENDEEEILT